MSYLRLHFLTLAALLLVGGLIPTVFAEEGQGGEVVEPQSSVPSPVYPLAWNPPRSLQTLVDERRDALRDKREAFHDNLRKTYGIASPWMDQERELWRAYSDQQRAAYRIHRDAMKLRHDQWRAFYMPWSNAFHQAAEARHYEQAMARLDEEEAMDELRFAHQPAFDVPLPW